MNESAERRPVVGYEGIYEVSSDGDVFRVGGGQGAVAGSKLKPQLNKKGYLHVRLCRDGVKKIHRVHRIVAEAFHPNPDNLPHVNHLNGIKSDNRADNLEPSNPSLNNLHAYRVLGVKRSPDAGSPKRPVRGTNLKTGETIEMESTSAAARFVNGSHANIGKACQGKQKTAYGWRWEYIDLLTIKTSNTHAKQ
jgi:hypothetical protein